MAQYGYTNQDLLNLVLIHGECEKIASRTCRVFAERHPNLIPPTRKILNAVLKNLQEHGSFKAKITREKPITSNEDNEINVLAYFTAYPNSSIREATKYLPLSYSSIQRILKIHKWRPYSYTLVQNLQLTDLQKRVEFCEWFILQKDGDGDFLNNMIWADEAKFNKNGMFNRHNSHYWADENPHVIRRRGFQNTWSFNVFCAIKGSRIICLHFYDENLNGVKYLQILNTVVQAALNNMPPHERNQSWYQQDGATPHSVQSVSDKLEEMFDGRWLANKGPYRWPPRSPDLNPVDFSIWGYVKNLVYQHPLTTKEDAMNRVRQAFASLTAEQLSQITNRAVIERYEKCLQQNGDVFEHLL